MLEKILKFILNNKIFNIYIFFLSICIGMVLFVYLFCAEMTLMKAIGIMACIATCATLCCITGKAFDW